MLKFVLLMVIYSLPVFAQNAALTLNDVSILLPLPAKEDWDLLPKSATEAKKGILLSKEVVASLPQLIAMAPNDQTYDFLRVVGIRIDPCFTEGRGPVKCQQQIRFVWQILSDMNDETSTFDASLHTFYSVTPDELQQLVSEIKSLKAELNINEDPLAPLGIHPVIQQQGLKGQYYLRLMTLIYKYVGQSNFTRITFMQLFMTGNIWEFGGFDVKDGELKVITIPRINSNTQQFVNSAKPAPTWFKGGLNPAPNDADNFNLLTKDSTKLSLQTEAEIVASTKAAFKFENPSLHNPGTLDCVSCHVAQAAKSFTLSKFPSLQLDQLSRDVIYTSGQNLQNVSPLQNQTNIIRAFGYFMESPFVAQRTINESAEVVQYFNLNDK